jgi:chromatin remodeling complex protein RSC6
MAKKATTPAAKGAKETKPATARKPNAAFMKPMNVSSDLQSIVGKGPMPRTEVTKKVWEYIKKNNLQDAKEKRNINADNNLQKVFGGKKNVNMFEMTKLINQHLS